MFTWCELRLSAPPDVSESDGVHLVRFPAQAAGSTDPVLTVAGEGDATLTVSLVLGRDILSVAAGPGGPRLSVFPDGRILVRGDDTLFQERPGRRGAQLAHGETSVTISPDGHVIVVGPVVSLVVDAKGNVLRGDRALDAAPAVRPAESPAETPGDDDRIVPFPRRDDTP